MKPLYLFLCFVVFTCNLQGQIQRQSASTARIVANIDLVNGHFEMHGTTQRQGTLIQDLTATLHLDAIEFQFDLQRGSANQHYNVSLAASLNGVQLPVNEDDLLGFYGADLPVVQTGEKKLEWINLFERYIQLEGELVLIVNSELWGPRSLPLGVDCQEEPQFTSKQIWPHYAAAGLGAAALVASALIGNKSSDIYDNDYKAQLLEEKAESSYQDANDKHHNELILRYTGIGILATDAAVYIYRYYRYKHRLSVYQEYCQPDGVSFEPSFMTTPGSVSYRLGVRMTYNF